jgi:hypothetical protein
MPNHRLSEFLGFKVSLFMTAKCSCQNCNGHIEFDCEGIQPGTVAQCPHCGMDTALFIPPPVILLPPTKRRRHWPWLLAIALLIILGVAVVVFARVYQIVHFDDSVVKPDEHLKEVQGVSGWILGAVLPSQFDVVTNDAIGESGLKYNIPLEGLALDQAQVYWLDLTEERKVASIFVTIPTDQKDTAVFDALRGKYGLRRLERRPSEGGYIAYFGTTNRQAVFTQLTGKLTSMWIEYRDEELCKLAQRQQEKRRAAVDRQKAEEIKSHI